MVGLDPWSSILSSLEDCRNSEIAEIESWVGGSFGSAELCMARRRRDKSEIRLEAGIKAVAWVILLTSLAIGGIQGFLPVLISLVFWGVGLAVVGGVAWVAFRKYQNRVARAEAHDTPAAWTPASVWEALGEIDWFQFEKFCAELLRAEGFHVERRGGAQPDGGVDLVVSQDGLSALIQCKHWKTWNVQEKVVREMLGSMTHFGVEQGAIYTLKGATKPAKEFAQQHDIDLVDGQELAQRASAMLTQETLSRVLDTTKHHCPKCESEMVWRTGDFKPFWGCSRFPRCRGTLRHSGAK